MKRSSDWTMKKSNFCTLGLDQECAATILAPGNLRLVTAIMLPILCNQEHHSARLTPFRTNLAKTHGPIFFQWKKIEHLQSNSIICFKLGLCTFIVNKQHTSASSKLGFAYADCEHCKKCLRWIFFPTFLKNFLKHAQPTASVAVNEEAR